MLIIAPFVAPGLQSFQSTTSAPESAGSPAQQESDGGADTGAAPAAPMTDSTLADACADDAVRIGRGRYMRLLREALGSGIRTVPDAPDSIRALFAELDAVPGWVDLPAIEQLLDEHQLLRPPAA